MNILNTLKDARELELGDELIHIFKMQNEVDYVNSSVYNRKLTKKIGYDVLAFINDSYGIYDKFFQSKTSPEPVTEDIVFVGEFNMALARSLNSLVRLMTSVNIGHSDINNYYETLLTELKLHDVYFFKDHLMQTLILYGRYNNINDRLYNNPEINLRPSVRWKEPVDNFLKGGTIVNEVYLQLLIGQYWDLQHHMFIALKKLPDNIENDFEPCHNALMEVWLHFFRILDFLGHDHDSVGRLYSVYHHIKTNTHA